MTSPRPDDQATARLDALLRLARRAPWPPAADRLAPGFGARMEARLRAASAEAATASRLLWRWLLGLGTCSAVILVLAGAAGRRGAPPADGDRVDDTSFQSDWASYTAVPDAWPAP